MKTMTPFKTYGGAIPTPLMRVCLRHADKIEMVGNEGDDGYWIILSDDWWNAESNTSCIHQWTVKDCIRDFAFLRPKGVEMRGHTT